jgi:hypothetical protein
VTLGGYFRWTETEKSDVFRADILGTETEIIASKARGMVSATMPTRWLDADEARMIGVRLIEAAVLADSWRSIRGGSREAERGQ